MDTQLKFLSLFKVFFLLFFLKTFYYLFVSPSSKEVCEFFFITSLWEPIFFKVKK